MKDSVALLVVDVQERLLRAMHDGPQTLKNITTAVQGFREMTLPIVVTEQYPEGLGRTVPEILNVLGTEVDVLSKTQFSGVESGLVRSKMSTVPANTWVLCGLEAHVCVLLTARDLIATGKNVVVLLDATTSRKSYHVTLAAGEMRHLGVRVTSVETMLFDLLGDANAPAFKTISRLVR